MCQGDGYKLAPCLICMILLLMLQRRALCYLRKLTYHCRLLAGLMHAQLYDAAAMVDRLMCELDHVFQQRQSKCFVFQLSDLGGSIIIDAP